MANPGKEKDDLAFHQPHDFNSSSSASDDVTFAHREKKASTIPDIQYPYHQEHGAPIDNFDKDPSAEEDYQHHKNLWWNRVRHHLKDPFAEFMGTFIMILFGDGSVAQVYLSANPKLPKSSQNRGDYQSISWG